MSVPLKTHIANITELYRLRNALHLRGEIRPHFLLISLKSLIKKIRKGERNKTVLAEELATIFARTITYADLFVELPIIIALCEKLPAGKCGYCQDPQCTCQPNRKHEIRIEHITPDNPQLLWSTGQWIAGQDGVYGATNRILGIDYVLLRLIEEILEVIEADYFENACTTSVSTTERRMTLAREFADVIGRTFALCALLEIDIESILLERYAGNCTHCNQRPCDCPSPFLMEEEQRKTPLATPL